MPKRTNWFAEVLPSEPRRHDGVLPSVFAREERADAEEKSL
jgi:hypothetical protein